MVQVDVFWSYAFGAGFAMSAARQLAHDREKNNGNFFENKYFTHTLLFLSILFVPSGASLLWAYPDWETMQVAVNKDSLPVWLVTAFTITNITQGLLGFWVTYHFIIKKKLYAAFFQSWISYFLFFFILVHGWDGTGYQRFFSFTRPDFLAWNWANAKVWLTCPVALMLLFWGVFLVPWLGLLCGRWIIDGYNYGNVDVERAKQATFTGVCLDFLKLIFGYGLGMAIGASLLIHGAEKLTGSFSLGWVLGVPVFAVLAYLLVLRRKMLLYRLADSLILPAGELT
ncbi:MAG: hypothetical protein PHE84_15260 [bacterium]|nr:hypothetical protein [bacterium]